MIFFKNIFYSIAIPNRYPEMVKRGFGKAMIYLLLMAVIYTVVGFIYINSQFSKAVNELQQSAIEKMPNFEFQNGKLNVDGEMPIVINDNNQTIIIDTTGKTTEDSLKSDKETILITDHKLIDKNGMQIRTTDLSQIQMTFTKENVIKMIPYLKVVSVVIGIFLFPFFIVAKLFVGLILSVITLLINLFIKVEAGFGKIMTTSIYAQTFPTILTGILFLLGINLNFFLYLLISIIFMVLGLFAMKKEAI